jgi:hypothetical protein
MLGMTLSTDAVVRIVLEGRAHAFTQKLVSLAFFVVGAGGISTRRFGTAFRDAEYVIERGATSAMLHTLKALQRQRDEARAESRVTRRLRCQEMYGKIPAVFAARQASYHEAGFASKQSHAT